MSAPGLILQRGSKPISVAEFRDALGALYRSRPVNARHVRPRPLALAISGGVDSMALAFLFTSLMRTDPTFQFADHPTNRAYGILVDHRLRQGSCEEAAAVSQELSRIGLEAVIETVDWSDVKQSGQDPSLLSNLESAARLKRYQALGITCKSLGVTSLFFAHHSDDQYETLLMRLLAGQGYRGLRGMRHANPIPECYDIHGVYKSGLLDNSGPRDLSNSPMRADVEQIRQFLREDSPKSLQAQYESQQVANTVSRNTSEQLHRSTKKLRSLPAPLEYESGGVTVYRPLLDFDKNRLIATCEANKIRWFEDHTNLDPKLTPRNAIRYITAAHTLPTALQKPAILALSYEARHRIWQEEVEARRWLDSNSVVQDFNSNVGTLLAKLPSFIACDESSGSRLDTVDNETRKRHQKKIAALAIRYLINLVTPQRQPPNLTALWNVVDRLFPELAYEAEVKKDFSKPLNSFCIANVHFEAREESQWFLCRAPYKSRLPLPRQDFWAAQFDPKLDSRNPQQPAGGQHSSSQIWKQTKMWDWRFWIQLETRVPANYCILPFMPEHSNAFRLALRHNDRVKFEELLRQIAPGKIRFTLPALYVVERADAETKSSGGLEMLALPSLGVHIPGLQKRIKYKVRYKNIDGASSDSLNESYVQ